MDRAVEKGRFWFEPSEYIPPGDPPAVGVFGDEWWNRIAEQANTLRVIVQQPAIAFEKREAAKLVGMSVRFIEREIAAGRLPAKKAGNKVIIGRDALAQWFSALPDAAYSANRRAPDEGTQKTREIARDVVGGVPRKRGRKPKDQGAA